MRIKNVTVRICLALALTLALGITASARYTNVYELFSEWETSGYPDYVAGVYSADGGSALVIQLVEGHDDKAAELQALVTEELVFEFGAACSYSELLRIQEEITQNYMIGGEGVVVGCGVGWTSVDGEAVGFGESGKEFRVTVDVLPEAAEKYAGLLSGLYGDAVVVSASEGITLDTAAGADSSAVLDDTALREEIGLERPAPAQSPLAWLLPLALLLAAGGAVLLRRRALQTTGGNTVTDSPLTRARTEAAVRESSPAEPKTGFEELKRKL